MLIKWLGHSCFLIVSSNGVRIIIDPYAVNGKISYSPIDELADIVVVTHEHGDHNNISAVRGKPEVVKGAGTSVVKGIQFKGVATYHDKSQGRQRGPNTVFCFTVDGIRLCHLGDLGHLLDTNHLETIGGVDILFIPVGGFYTIDATEAGQVCGQLNPQVAIPMHFKTPKCAYPISGVEDFLEGKKNVRKANSSEAEFTLEELPHDREILVLEPAS
jgi:L-ascorbate metabolism protein UlaG (beta-lactamase superfamily)